MKSMNRRKKVLAGVMLAAGFLLVVCIGGAACSEWAVATDFTQKNLPPGAGHLFGTDWMGRDMLARTLKGLSLSILLGILAAGASACIALILGIASATLGKIRRGFFPDHDTRTTLRV